MRGWFVENCFQQIGTLDELIDISIFLRIIFDIVKLQNLILINFSTFALMYTIILNIAQLSFIFYHKY